MYMYYILDWSLKISEWIHNYNRLKNIKLMNTGLRNVISVTQQQDTQKVNYLEGDMFAYTKSQGLVSFL